jgi:hypothetical protein
MLITLNTLMIPMAIRLAMRCCSSWRIALYRPSLEKLILLPDDIEGGILCLLQGAGQELGQRLGERVLDAVRREEVHYRDIRIPATVSVGGA